jgi:hypothetical protein
VVTIAASSQGAFDTGLVTVLKASDTITISKTEFVVSKGQFKLEVSTTHPATASVKAFKPATGAWIGNLIPAGAGKFTGQFTIPAPFTSVAVQSANGGLAIGAVTQKYPPGGGGRPHPATTRRSPSAPAAFSV